MGGNRKHGFLRGNRGGFKLEKMYCDGCRKSHRAGTDMTRDLLGRNFCDRTYYKFRHIPSPPEHQTPTPFAPLRLRGSTSS